MPGPRPTALLFLAALTVAAAVLLLLPSPPADPSASPEEQGGSGEPGMGGVRADDVRLRGRVNGAPQAPGSTARGASDRGRGAPAGSDPGHVFFDEAFRLRLLDPSGEGVGDVVLTIRAHGRRGPVVTAPHEGAWESGTSRTGADGRVEVRGGNLAGGVVTISFLHGPDDVVLPGPARIPVTDEEATIRLERAVSVSGQVVFDRALPPPERVTVEARWSEEGAGRSRRVSAADDGRFRVGGLPPGATLDILAFPLYPLPAGSFPGRARSSPERRLPVLVPQPPSVVPHSPAPEAAGGAWGVRAGADGVVIALDGPPALDVRAVDATGELLSRPVRVVPVGPSPHEATFGRVSPEGRLVIRAAPPGRYRLEPLQDGLRALEVDLPHAGRTLVFPRVSFRSVSGRVLGSGDLRGFRVEIRSDSSAEPVIVVTDAAGAFSASVPGGPLSFRASRFGDSRSGARRDVPEDVESVDVPLDRGLEIRGVVLDVNQAPIAFAGWARVEGASVVETTPVLPGGRFSFASLPPGRYTLRVGGDGATSEATLEGVEAGSLDVAVRLGSSR